MKIPPFVVRSFYSIHGSNKFTLKRIGNSHIQGKITWKISKAIYNKTRQALSPWFQEEEEKLMTGHLTLFLACFSFNFSRFYKQKRGVLEQFFIISGHLQWFIFECVFLLFPKHINFRMFCCKFTKKSCISTKRDIWRFVKSFGRWMMNIQEAS